MPIYASEPQLLLRTTVAVHGRTGLRGTCGRAPRVATQLRTKRLAGFGYGSPHGLANRFGKRRSGVKRVSSHTCRCNSHAALAVRVLTRPHLASDSSRSRNIGTG